MNTGMVRGSAWGILGQAKLPQQSRIGSSGCLSCLRKVVVAREVEAEEHSEVVGKFGEPCRGRTYGPLIKSLVEDLLQKTLQEESPTKSEDS